LKTIGNKQKEEIKKQDTQTVEIIKSELGEVKIEKEKLLPEKQLLEKLDGNLKKKLITLESELYANIATLNSISKNFEEGRVDPTTFKRQLRALMKSTFKAKRELEKLGLDVIDFIKNEGILDEFTAAVNKLKLTSDKDTIRYSIMLESPGKIASKTFNIASEFATILDLVKLKYNATYEMVIKSLTELQNSFRNYPGFGSKHWIYIEIEQWKKKLNTGKPSEVISEETLSSLESSINMWKNEFDAIIDEVSK